MAKTSNVTKLPPYKDSLAGALLGAREAVMAPIRPILRDANLSEQQWRVLRVLSDDGEMDATNLAEAAMLLAPSVTRILRELESRGLLRRQLDTSDGRRQIVSISKEGLALIKTTSKRTIQLLATYARQFGPGRIDQLIIELHDLMAAIAESEG